MKRLPNVILMGPTGTGKTHSLRTLRAAGLTTFAVFTEPGFEVVEDVPDEWLHWHYIAPTSVSWDTLKDNAKKVNMFDNDALQKMPGVNRDKYQQAFELMDTFHNFKCDRCGKAFGDVSTWGEDRAVVLDSLSGLNDLMKGCAVGAKPILSQPDWGKAMNLEDSLIKKLTTDTNCMFVLIAHVERLMDEVAGGMTLTLSALGRKLGPEMPRNFSDVILTVREGDQFYWNTAAGSADVKARNLSINAKLPPTFTQIITAWKGRQLKGVA